VSGVAVFGTSVVGLGAVAVVAAIAGAAVSAGCTGGDAGAWSAVDRVSPRWLENAPRSSPSANVAIAIGRPRVDCAGAGGRTVTATGLMETGATRGAAWTAARSWRRAAVSRRLMAMTSIRFDDGAFTASSVGPLPVHAVRQFARRARRREGLESCGVSEALVRFAREPGGAGAPDRRATRRGSGQVTGARPDAPPSSASPSGCGSAPKDGRRTRSPRACSDRASGIPPA
jgi:hypothetical protein